MIHRLQRPGDSAAPRSRPAIAAILLLGFVLIVSCGGGDVLEQARRAYERDEPERAMELYRAYLEEHPDDFDVRKEYTILMGERWAFRGGDREPILDNLETLYAQRPGDEKVQDLLSIMLIREGQAASEEERYEDAEETFRRAVAVNPDAGTAQYHLGRLYQRTGQPERALNQYRAAASKRPPIPDLFLRLGNAYLERGRLQEAIDTLELVLELQGTSTYLIPRAHCSLAQALARSGRLPEARRHLERAGRDCRVDGL